jgi:hypothetical protein
MNERTERTHQIRTALVDGLVHDLLDLASNLVPFGPPGSTAPEINGPGGWFCSESMATVDAALDHGSRSAACDSLV